MQIYQKWYLEYCIRLTSSEDQNLCRGGGTWADAWDGGALELVHNGNVIHTFQPLFESDEKCLRSDQVDPINDVFQIRSTTNDSVSCVYLEHLYLKFFYDFHEFDFRFVSQV